MHVRLDDTILSLMRGAGRRSVTRQPAQRSAGYAFGYPTASEVVPGRREAASPEPITTVPGGMDSRFVCRARAPE